MADEEGLLDLADIEVTEPPAGWSPEEDHAEFDPKDRDEDSDG